MIYLYHLKINETVMYVGLTKNPIERQRAHKKRKPLPHDFVIVEAFDTISKANTAERDQIEKHRTHEAGWNISPGGDYLNNFGFIRKGVGGVKRGNIPWNKNKVGCFSEQTIETFRRKRKGVVHSSKVTEDIVREIRKRFDEHPPFKEEGVVGKNGKSLTKARLFSNLYCSEYSISNINLYNIITGKSWKNIE